jgi:hypothetical protein
MMGASHMPPVGGKPLPGMVMPNQQQQQAMISQQQQAQANHMMQQVRTDHVFS